MISGSILRLISACIETGVGTGSGEERVPGATPVPRPIQVAYLIPGLHYGGMERILDDLTKALPPREFEVHVVIVGGFFGRFADGLGEVADLHKVPAMSKFSLIYPGQTHQGASENRPGRHPFSRGSVAQGQSRGSAGW